MAQRVEQAQAQGVTVEVWANDEHRIGLKPVLRRVWARRGERPVALVEHRYKWSYLHGFVRPQDGATFWWLTSWIDIQAWQMVLHQFAAWVGAGPQPDGSFKSVLLVVDQAGWHTSPDVQLPPGLELVFLPPRSPELQPCERLWPLSNEAICNQRFDDLQHLELAQAQRCRQLQHQHQLVHNYTCFHWWPNTH